MASLNSSGDDPAARLRPEVRSPVPQDVQGEVYQEGKRLVASFYLPAIGPREFRYHVGRRTITVWSRKDGAEFQSILVLPRWVHPASFILSQKNGLYEFLLEVESPDTLPA